MVDVLLALSLLAQGGEDRPPPGIPWELIGLMAILGVMFYFLFVLPERRRRASHESLLDALKTNDRVLFAGGIYGTVAKVHKESGDVTLKVDDNTRIRVRRASITQVMTEDKGEAGKGS